MRASSMLLLVPLAGCEADLGRPTVQEIVQDAGRMDAGGDAAVDAEPTLTADGAACTLDGDCRSGHCFVGGMASYCSEACTTANAATACASAPFNGVCNIRGFCRRP